MTPCTGLFGHVFGHKFRPREDCEAAPDAAQKATECVQHLSRALEEHGWLLEDVIGSVMDGFANLEKSVYVQDVCERCGEVVKRLP